MTRDDQLELIGVYNLEIKWYRQPTTEELLDYEASLNAPEVSLLDPVKIEKARADRARLLELTN